MSHVDIDMTCSCGATFEASGDGYAIGLRCREWIEAHRPCVGNKVETTEESKEQ
jgi:hypothetical protein